MLLWIKICETLTKSLLIQLKLQNYLDTPFLMLQACFTPNLNNKYMKELHSLPKWLPPHRSNIQILVSQTFTEYLCFKLLEIATTYQQ